MSLPRVLAALAETAFAPGATVRPDPEATVRASPFLVGAVTLPPVDVRFPESGGEGGADLVVRGVLGEGGMGRVYLAEQRTLAREVAIKTARDPSDPAQTSALLWEGAITGHLDVPGVTPVHALGMDAEGRPLLVMKRLSGVRWSELLEEPRPWEQIATLPRDRLRAHVEILMEVARTTHHAHARGVLHLDIKPDNVMVGALGDVTLVDWGVATTVAAAAERTTSFAGTPAFVAPEVVAGEPVGPWTDVYLLGAVLHVVLTGRPRHAGGSLREVLERAAESAPIAFGPEVPRELAALVNQATHRDRAARPADALAFRAALAEHLEHAASLDLAREGAALLSTLDGAAAPERAARALTEARFAFRAALARWGACPEAREGLRAALERTAALELARENLAGARDAAAELEEVPPALAAALEALEARLRRRAESEEALRRATREQDLSTGGRARTISLAAVSALLVVVTVADGFEPMDPRVFAEARLGETLALPTMLLVLLGIGIAIFGRAAARNAVGRRTILVFVVTTVALFAHRVATFLAGTPGLHVVVGDLVCVAAGLSALAIFVRRRVWVVIGLLCAGVVSILAAPPHASQIFNLCSAACMGGMAWALRGDGARAPAEAG